jgi:hypothetical protein
MKSGVLSGLLCGLVCAAQLARVVPAQEASSGFDLKATLSAEAVTSNTLTEAPRDGSPETAGFRGVAYPTWKISNNWFVTGALQLATRPYFYADFSTIGYGAKGNVLQASLNYSRVSAKGSLLLRAGQLSTAFGSFPLRYDDADNTLVDLPIEYGYYYSPVSVAGIAGAEIDASRGRWDGRAQFANSSPSNPRSLLAHDQYGNWAGGAGYTIHQGFRVGISGYRGPYLDRQSPFFFPGEANPNKTPAHALGADVSWARGHTSAQAEVQKFIFPYTAIPTFAELAAYAEVSCHTPGPDQRKAARPDPRPGVRRRLSPQPVAAAQDRLRDRALRLRLSAQRAHAGHPVRHHAPRLGQPVKPARRHIPSQDVLVHRLLHAGLRRIERFNTN